MKRLLPPVVFFSIIFLGVGPAIAAPSGIFTAGSTGQREFVDPIVSPGVRSAHEHCFYGAVGVETIETSESLRAKPETWAVNDNHTAVWIPCVYEDGVILAPATTKHILLYYKPVAGTEQVPPDNTAGVTSEYGWRCGTGGGTFFPTPPTTCSSGILVATLDWRAERDLHVSNFPTVKAYIRLNVGSGAVGNITIGGPVEGVDGATDATHMHGDYMFGWGRDTFERFLVKCVRPGVACGTNPVV